MSKQKFIRGIVEIVMSGVPLNFFESRGFYKIYCLQLCVSYLYYVYGLAENEDFICVLFIKWVLGGPSFNKIMSFTAIGIDEQN